MFEFTEATISLYNGLNCIDRNLSNIALYIVLIIFGSIIVDWHGISE